MKQVSRIKKGQVRTEDDRERRRERGEERSVWSPPALAAAAGDSQPLNHPIKHHCNDYLCDLHSI